jgi:hypothetical protein
MTKSKKTKYTLSFETRAEANAFIRGLEFRSICEKIKKANYEEINRLTMPSFDVHFTVESFPEVISTLKEKGIME